MTLPSLPQTLIPAVSFLAWFVVGWLKHSKLPTWGNALIALLVPVFAAILWGIATSAFTVHSLWGNIAIIVVLSYAALALPELAPWRQWLQDTLQSPFAWWPAPVTVEATPTIRRASLPPSRVPRYPLDETLRPMPPVLPMGSVRIVAQPSQTPPLLPPGSMEPSPHATAPMQPVTPEPPTPIEESPAQS